MPWVTAGSRSPAHASIGRGTAPLLFPKCHGLFYPLARFQSAGRAQRHLGSVGGDHPAIRLSDLVTSPVNRIDRVRVHKLKGHGIVDGVFDHIPYRQNGRCS